jgi:hypothetical protein
VVRLGRILHIVESRTRVQRRADRVCKVGTVESAEMEEMALILERLASAEHLPAVARSLVVVLVIAAGAHPLALARLAAVALDFAAVVAQSVADHVAELVRSPSCKQLIGPLQSVV